MTSLTSMYMASGRWQDYWTGNLGEWLRTKGLHIRLVILAALLATRLINWIAGNTAARWPR